MKLHENRSLYRDAIQFTSQKMSLRPEYIEKDYWITYSLFTIFNSEIGKDVVFKGGTALSKCYQMIDRFSEDIDLVILRRKGETNSKLKSKLKTISQLVGRMLPEINQAGITHKRGMNRKTAHSYNREFRGDYGQVRDFIVLESTWLGHYEPFTRRGIVSFLGQMMLENAQYNIAEENGLLAFDLMVLEPTRTICEKIMSLVRFSYSDDPNEALRKKVRHTYDLHQLLKQDKFLNFFYSKGFDEMLLKVASDDLISFRNNNEWLFNHPSKAYLFKDLEDAWNIMKTTYSRDFKDLVYGDFPSEGSIAETLRMIRERLQEVTWTIKIEA